MSEANAFTPDEIAFGAQNQVLGPAYLAARNATEQFMAAFEVEHFKPLIEKFTDNFCDKLWGDLENSLLSDTESNLQGSLWRMVDATINALLTGEQWALERYVLAQERYCDAPKVRAAIVQHCGKQLVAGRVTELEAEIAELKADNARLRGRY